MKTFLESCADAMLITWDTMTDDKRLPEWLCAVTVIGVMAAVAYSLWPMILLVNKR